MLHSLKQVRTQYFEVLLILIFVIEIPGAPLNLESSNVTHTSAIIQWTEPSNTGAPSLTGYMVIVYPTVQGSPFFTNDTDIVINGLTPSDDYIISVAAISAFYPQGGSKANITIATVEGRKLTHLIVIEITCCYSS